MKQQRAVGIIPARYGSTRFPGKPMADLAGLPMVVRVYQRARQARGLDRVIVATDDRRIMDAVQQHGGEAVMTAADHASGTDRLAEAAAGLDADIILNIQGDEPLLDPDIIDLVITAMRERPEIPMATVARELKDLEDQANPNLVKVVVDRSGYALYFSRAVIPYPRYAEYRHCLGHIGLYGYRRDFLLAYPKLPRGPLEQCEALEQLRALENGRRILVLVHQGDYSSPAVDTPEDLARVRALLGGE